MTKEILKTKSKEEVFDYIRKKLSFNNIEKDLRYVEVDLFSKEHRRFDMSGYDSDGVGSCTLKNMAILNMFADLGIYDYTSYLFIDFYQGTPTIYLKYWRSDDNLEIENLSGCGTVELIYKIFELTIFSKRIIRRRG